MKMKKYKLDESELFNLNCSINVLGIELVPEELKYKTGTKRIVTYEAGPVTIKGVTKEDPYAKAHVSFEDVFKTKTVNKRLVTFEFVHKEDEKAYLKSLKDK